MKHIYCPNCNMELVPTEEEMYTVNPFDDEQYQHLCPHEFQAFQHSSPFLPPAVPARVFQHIP